LKGKKRFFYLIYKKKKKGVGLQSCEVGKKFDFLDENEQEEVFCNGR